MDLVNKWIVGRYTINRLVLRYDYFFKQKTMLYYLDDPSLPLKVLKQQLETVSLESFYTSFISFCS